MRCWSGPLTIASSPSTNALSPSTSALRGDRSAFLLNLAVGAISRNVDWCDLFRGTSCLSSFADDDEAAVDKRAS